MNKLNGFTNKSDIRWGFEVECVIPNGYRTPRRRWGFSNADNSSLNPPFSAAGTEFNKAIKALSNQIRIGKDSSIKCNEYDRPVEIKTPPLPPLDAMILLEKILIIVNKYGYTNNSCGFHSNLSSRRKNKMKQFNPIPFLSASIWDEMLKKFKRKSNTYCRPLVEQSKKSTAAKFHIVHNLVYHSKADKYRCVNMTHFGNGFAKSSRIEIRGMGNVNYSKKFDTIAAYIKRIERLFNLSCGSFSKMRIPKV